jgi:hypothetical protein
MGADKRMRRCRLSAYRLSIRCADAGLRPGGLRQDHAAKRVGLPFRIGDRIARRKDPKTTPGLTPLQIRRVCGGVLWRALDKTGRWVYNRVVW